SATNADSPSASSSTSKALATDKEALTHVTQDNFRDYFALDGSATYKQDNGTGTVTITPDESNKVGSFFLNSKIDMNTSFTLTGQINLGKKTSSQGGADGIGFAFHTGNTNEIGNSGGNLGIGGLQNAIGFKLDTYHNDYGIPQANEDGAQVASTDSNGYGWAADPDRKQFPQFGAFVYTSQKLVQAQDGKSYSRWWGVTDMSSAQTLNSGDLDGQFHDFVISYDGSSRELTIKYTETGGKVLTWSTSIPGANQAIAMVVSASTGANKNLQQFKISSFDFKQAATVNVKYVDQKGNQLAQGTVSYPSGADVNGTYTTGQLEIPNYKFVRMDDGTATGAKSLPATGTLTEAGDNGTVIYVYAPAYTQTSKTISETIKYIDQDGKEVAKGYTADPITFVTVTNPVDNTTTTYYSTKAKTATLDNNGVPVGDWTRGNSTDFAAIINPSVIGQHVVSTTDPSNDLTQTTVKSIDSNSDNFDFTVTYKPNQEAAKVTYIDDTTRKTLSAKDLTGDYGSTDPYRTGDTIADYEKQGYQLVPDNYPTHGVVYNQDGTGQKFEVHLTHGTTPVGPKNPQTPGEPINPDNPDGPKWPEGTDKSSVTQTVTRTVNYLDKQTGKAVAKQVTEQVTYNRTAIVDKVTGQIIGYSTTGGDTVEQTDGDKAWTAVDNKSDWDSVTSPDLSSKGYLAPDLATVAQQTVTPGDKDVTVNVYYDHDVVPVNPTNPQTPGTPINPDDPDSPKWPAGTDKNSLTTDIHQTIHYQYGDGSQAAPDKTDSTTFDHQVEIDKVTGEIVKDDGWTAENGKTSFDSKNSPVIPGYTASKPASDSVDGLTQDSKDNVQTIIYTSNQEAANVTYIDDKTSKTLSAKALTGDYGSTDSYRTGDTIADYEKQGYQLVSDNYPTHGVVYNQDGTVQSFEVHLTHGTTQTSG
ncbi:lectin-like domain-containing protein, partial [Lacticaseibacillus paracasei]